MAEAMSDHDPIYLAMWSGARNISTAMMRSRASRPDTFVCDEPLYAHYLQVTRRSHPGADEVIANGETDWRKVVQYLTGSIPQQKRIFYQKQMTHHLLPQIDRAWLRLVTNCFLIRDPREVIISYLKKNDELALEDIGFVQQLEIFNSVREQTGAIPAVIDARDVLENPRRILTLLCESVGVGFSEAMLSWAPGLRETDGIWAKHWYNEVQTSTTFREPPARQAEAMPEDVRGVYEKAREFYEQLYQHRLH